MTYTCVDGFSGAGGLSLGLIRASYDVLLSFDNDPVCVETQRLNGDYFRHKALAASVDDMLSGGLLKHAGLATGELFLLAGGPPCQGFSIQRIGDDRDERNDLIGKYIALVLEVMPRYFLMENVPGITGKRGNELLKEALRKASAGGYWIHKAELDAQDFGVPQRRRRVIIVGERSDDRFPGFWFPTPSTPKDRITVRMAIGHLPPPTEDGGEHSNITLHRADRLSDLNRRRLSALGPGQGRDQLPYDLLAECHRRSSSQIGHRNVYGRMAWDEVAPTITARFDSFTRGMFGHPEQLRSISLREGALLQSFPQDFAFAGNKVEAARQIGNAVPPLLAEAIGTQIILCHETKMGIELPA